MLGAGEVWVRAADGETDQMYETQRAHRQSRVWPVSPSRLACFPDFEQKNQVTLLLSLSLM